MDNNDWWEEIEKLKVDKAELQKEVDEIPDMLTIAHLQGYDKAKEEIGQLKKKNKILLEAVEYVSYFGDNLTVEMAKLFKNKCCDALQKHNEQ